MENAQAAGGATPSHGQDAARLATYARGDPLAPYGLLFPLIWGPRWRAAQTFIRRVRLGVWERLRTPVQPYGIQLGVTVLDGTSVRAHNKAAGAHRKGALKLNETIVRRLVDLVATMHLGLRDRRRSWRRRRVSDRTRSGA